MIRCATKDSMESLWETSQAGIGIHGSWSSAMMAHSPEPHFVCLCKILFLC